MNDYFAPGGALSKLLEGYEYRQSQVALAEKARKIFADDGVLLAEAGTGSGKTLAYLIPAILSGKKVVISTGTLTLQEQIAKKDIPLLEKMFPGRFRAAVMKGRQNYLCRRRFRAYMRQRSMFTTEGAAGSEAELLRGVESWAATTKSGDRAEIGNLPDDFAPWGEINSRSELCIGSACADFDDSFITRMRAEAAMADIVIVNHHLFFADLNVRENAFGAVIPSYDAVVFDEAHMVEEIATTYFGQAISNHQIAEAIRDTERELLLAKLADTDTAHALAGLGRRSRAFFTALSGAEGRRRIKKQSMKKTHEASDELIISLNVTADAMASIRQGAESIKGLVARYRDLADLLREIVSFDKEDYVYWVETRGRGVFLQATPIDVSCHLREKLYPRAERVVFTSATLSVKGSFDYIKKRLGLTECHEAIIESPFDYRKQAIFYVALDLPDPSDPKFAAAAAERIALLLQSTKGRAFVLFTSHKNMNEVYTILEGRLPYTMFKQGDAPRSAILESFTDETDSVLFATTSFWQGVDVRGESLSAVIVDKLPFASPGDPVVEARIEFLKAHGENPFRTYQLPAAALALKQGLGRLIRSRSDTGLLAVLDKRIKTKQYGGTFVKSLPDMEVITDMGALEAGLGSLNASASEQEPEEPSGRGTIGESCVES